MQDRRILFTRNFFFFEEYENSHWKRSREEKRSRDYTQQGGPRTSAPNAKEEAVKWGGKGRFSLLLKERQRKIKILSSGEWTTLGRGRAICRVRGTKFSG